MSTSVPTHPAESPPEGMKTVDKIVVYGHSNLLYWWPVWLVSFALAAVTYMEQNRMAVVPDRTESIAGATVTTPDGPIDGPRDVLVAPAGKSVRVTGMTVSSNNNLGVIFVVTLVLVALASTILFRGLVSMIVIVLLIAMVILFAYFGWWDDILLFFGGLDIRMNAAGYLLVAIPLFVAWVFVVFVYDRQIYMVVDEGQIRYVLDVGDSAVSVQTEGATVEKKRDDVFRHWLLGFGTGDIVIRFGEGRKIDLENVIGVGRKLVVINNMIRHKPIVVESV